MAPEFPEGLVGHNQPVPESLQHLDQVAGGLCPEAVKAKQDVGVDGDDRLAEGRIQFASRGDPESYEVVFVQPRHPLSLPAAYSCSQQADHTSGLSERPLRL